MYMLGKFCQNPVLGNGKLELWVRQPGPLGEIFFSTRFLIHIFLELQDEKKLQAGFYPPTLNTMALWGGGGEEGGVGLPVGTSGLTHFRCVLSRPGRRGVGLLGHESDMGAPAPTIGLS